MVEGGGGPAFPVVFFDGEREMNIGDVRIYPTLEYKPFQLMLSQKIGISPNQISIYLVDRRKSGKSEERRRIPITGKVNFGLICRQRDCSFLVVLKRSRKSRSRRERMVHGVEFADLMTENGFSHPAIRSVPDNWILLRRNHQAPAPFHDQITQSELADLNDRLQNLRIQRENYQIAMAKPANFAPNRISFPTIDEFYSTPMTTAKAYCEECEKNGGTASFHPCVNDAVTATVSATGLGPIRRPNKPFP